MFITPTLLTDGYKIDHRRQYPKETKLVYSNFTPRKSRVEGVDEVVVFGIQYYILSTLIEIWNEMFFKRDIDEITTEFMEEMTDYTLNPAAAKAIGIQQWVDLHKLGYLPLEIKALPEGSKVPIRVPMFSVKNTHDDFYWLTNFIETDMSCEVWPTCTSATTADLYKRIFTSWAKETGGDLSFIDFQGHDFSYRGMFGRQAAQMSGAGHLTSFKGTDTIPAIKWLKKYYKASSKENIIGCSVFATEHAVMCVGTGFYITKDGLTWEKYGEAEFKVFKRLITELYPNGIVSIVCDTWDLWQVLTDYVVRLKDEILARDGKVVIRPDSGNPVDIICGSISFMSRNHYEASQANEKGETATPAETGVVELLWEVFGGTINEKGYKVLNPKIGCIYGDSITPERADQICARLATKGFCSTNWVAGIGSYTYTMVTRDTYGFAMKATYAEAEFENQEGKTVRTGIEIFKDPITDDGTKKSARGLLQVIQLENETGVEYELVDRVSWEDEADSCLETVFLNGKLVKETSLEEIRKRLTSHNN
jgi:nicotinamide phosphoribosyltransferase